MKGYPGRLFQVVAIIFMGLTGALNLLGGVGTVCAAFLTEQFPSMAALLDYRLLYQGLVIITVLIGLGGVWVTIRLVKGGSRVHRHAIIILLVGSVLGGVHYYASMTLRGSAAPANVKLYLNAFTLLLFLLLKIPWVSERVDFGRRSDEGVRRGAGGIAALAIGLVVITTSQWVGGTHTYEGANWTHMLREFLSGSGLASMAIGAMVLLAARLQEMFVRELEHTN